MKPITINPTSYQQYFTCTQATIGKAIAYGVKEVYINYPGTINKNTILEVLQTIINWHDDDLHRISNMISTYKLASENQLEADLWYGVAGVLDTYGGPGAAATAANVSDWVWVLENLVDAVKDDTIDGTEGDKDQKISKKAIEKEVLGKEQTESTEQK